MSDEIFVPNMRPNQVMPPSRLIFARMGEANIRAMLRDFYLELEQSEIRAMFPKDVVKASEKSADFFIGMLGGPPLYHQRHGNPMMRARHMPFAINANARQIWLDCFETVLADAEEKYDFPPEYLPGFHAFLAGFSVWMVNRAG
ncbi:MAG: hypothetical protein ACPG8W_12735 [Candidatus Promineifilaceae bacterium]